MRPNNVIDATVEGNLSGETVRMEIDAQATAHLMSVLTDLYSDRIMAFIREYATNAWDSHIEAGVTRPIEVTLPNRMSNYYRVKDYGIGLDLDGIRNIYSKYGTSTKRGSDSFNGMLGLGCKSAMTYAAQFSIISVKDGVKYNVAVSRGADGVGEMQVIDSTPTTEENGVEIVIPVKANDLWSVAEKAKTFFQWWPEGTVLVNGAAPKRFEGREIAKNLYMIDGLEGDLIVMGNVAYPVPFEGGIYAGGKDRWGYSRKTFGIVYFVEMGEVTFAPNREALQTTKNTKATVERAKELFIANLKKSLQAEFDALTSHVDVLRHRESLRNRYMDISFDDFTYKGEAIPNGGFPAPFQIITWPKTEAEKQFNRPARQTKEIDYFLWYDATGGATDSKMDDLDISRITGFHDRMVILVNAPKSLTPHQRTKIRRAYEDKVVPKRYVMLTSEATKPGGVWTDSIEVADWSIVRDYKVTNNTTSDSTKHWVYEATSNGVAQQRTVPDAEKVVYVSPSFFDRGNYYGPKEPHIRKYVNEAGYSFMKLAANRHAKFQREHPNSFSLENFMAAEVARYEKTLSEDAKVILGMDSEDVSRLKRLSGLDIADPAVVGLVKKATHADVSALRTEWNRHEAKVRHLSVRMPDLKTVRPFADYPLVSCLSSDEVRAHDQHVTDYINAVYSSKKKGN